MEAQKIAMNGCPNLWKVSDTLYRSAQPNKEGFKGLWDLGVREVINLRTLHTDYPFSQDTGFAYFNIPMFCWHPEKEDAIQFLRFTKQLKVPALVHCKHGSDRTGTMVALYRIIIEGWSKEDAVREMSLPQYGFHEIWENLKDWIEGMDLNKLKEGVA